LSEEKGQTGAPEPAQPANNEDDGALIAVGVGASAGGLEAFTELLRYLPAGTGMTFVLVQHLDPYHESALTELLSGRTTMPVVQVQDGTPLEANHVYIIPPNTVMTLAKRRLRLEPRPEAPERFRSVDIFFNSLAEEFHSNAIGIVLSGTASDGTWGLKTIKAEGGITFAQNQTAKFDGMPRSAIAAGVVDFILPPRRIAEELAAIAQRTRNLGRVDGELASHDSGTFHRLLLLLRKTSGVDFSQYKQPTILRRLRRRMLVRDTDSLEQYLELLQAEPGEIRSLFDDLLINVTDFFRDPDVFEALKRLAFPSMIRGRKSPYTIRAWVPGCSSGEEVYSLAIALVEFLESEDLDFAIQIFGTDISEAAVAKARAGVYDESAVMNVSPERLRRFFVRTEASYQVSRSVRDICIFSRHNVARDPPLSRMDLISCRNLLIYFSPSLQRRVISNFGYALQLSGCLILGPSETLGGLTEHFRALDEPHKIYCSRASTAQNALLLADGGEERRPAPWVAPYAPAAEPYQSGGRGPNQMVVSRYGPAGVVVDANLKIVEYRGDATDYLGKKPVSEDSALIELVREELRGPLATAIEQARRTNNAVAVEKTAGAGGERAVFDAITVVPLSPAGAAQYYLVLFGRSREQAPPENGRGTDLDADAASVPLPRENQILKQELRASREYLQSVIEELRSANEEAQSANEELQSTNEEMQTSKEELQSSNEELNTINAEMQSRNAELARLNDDLVNLLGSMNMPIVMTGEDLRIRRFTPAAEKVLRLIASDVGRPIADLKPRINAPDLEELLQRVIDSLQPYEREVKDEEGRFYLMRIRPYRTSDNRIDGAVLQLLEVSELKRSMEEARLARDYAEAIVNTVGEPLVVLDRDLSIQNANRAFYDYLDVSQASAGRSIYQVARAQFDQPRIRALFQQLLDGSLESAEAELEHQTERGGSRIVWLNARRFSVAGRLPLILLAFDDITERKRAAEARYRRLFESARDGIVLVDAASGAVIDINPFAERLLGFTENELAGRKFWEIESLREVPELKPALDTIRDRGYLRIDDLCLRTKDGRDLRAELIGNVYAEGDRPAIQLNIRDVSERKKFERELQETQKLESLGLLAGGIAHDFNNLLTGILGSASLAYAELAADQPLRVQLREIVQASERAAFLTRQMLAYAGRGRFVTETIDLGDLVKEISELIRTSIPKTVEIRLNLNPDLPRVEVDPAQVQQIVMNLVINGAEAIGDGAAGKVEVRTSVREMDVREANDFFGAEQFGPGTYVQLEVSDNGAGMDDATKSRIFDPFFTTKFTGRGLGLAAVLGIVRKHRGGIRVYSTPGQGTCFAVLFPASKRARTSTRPEPPRDISVPAGSIALVIDDEEVVRKVAHTTLTRAGMMVLTAEDGKAGVELFREHRSIVSVIILDAQMPVMGGEEALPLLRLIDPDIPVILTSGFDESEAARRFAHLNLSLFLQKPFTAQRLVQAVAATIESKKK
jgi:two-component system CheB/CheR fusion protein